MIRHPGFIPGVKRQLPKTKGTATYAYIIISLVKTKSVNTIVYKECLIQNCSTMGGLIAECGFFLVIRQFPLWWGFGDDPSKAGN